MSTIIELLEDVNELQERVFNLEQKEVGAAVDDGARIEIDCAVSDIKQIRQDLNRLINILLDKGVLLQEEV